MHPILEDLHEKQYLDLYHVDDAPLADLRSKALSRFGWWAVAFTATALLAGFGVTFPDTFQTPFVLKSQVAEETYRFPTAAYIEEMHVANGQQVTAGQPLVTLSSPDIAALISEYTSARDRLTHFERYNTVASRAEQDMLRLTIRQTKQGIALKESQRQVLQQQWASQSAQLHFEARESERVFKANQEIYRSGDISQNDLNRMEAAARQAEYAYQSAYHSYLSASSTLQQGIASGQLEINRIVKQMVKSRQDLSLEGEQLKSTLTAIRQRIEGTYGNFQLTDMHRLQLTAKRSGMVSFFFEGEKEVPPGTILLKMIYGDAPLYAYSQVNSSRIGKVKPGQPVVLKLDAFPVFDWGPLRGQVSSVSLTPDEKGLFNVRIQVTDYGQLNGLARIGMRGQGNIIFDDRTLYGYIFRKYRKVTSDLTD